ncbi:MAG: hypothetical protein HGB19_07970 [Chlorobiales bacterium]|nr:hypothetical protein [Chlorobiales bacterium]
MNVHRQNGLMTHGSDDERQHPSGSDPALRSSERAAIFVASLLIMTIGVSGIIEGAYLLFKTGILVEEKGLDSATVMMIGGLSLFTGLLQAACALGTIRLLHVAWKLAFLTTLIFLVNSGFGAYVFYGSPFSFGSVLHLIATLLIFLLLFKARTLFKASPDREIQLNA